MREEAQNRRVRFSGEGTWAEPLQPLAGRPFFTLLGNERHNFYTDQLAGRRIPNQSALNEQGQRLLNDLAIWDSYKLVHFTPDGFTLQKRTNPKSCWLNVVAGRRASGGAFVGYVSGGLGVGVRSFWQSYPSALEIRRAVPSAAELHVWLWSPDAPAMDMRHYDVRGSV